jgi:hypothetical protein
VDAHAQQRAAFKAAWLNEPLPPDNVSALVRPTQRSLNAVLCEALINTQALVTRLEAGVTVPQDRQREVSGCSMLPPGTSGAGLDLDRSARA